MSAPPGLHFQRYDAARAREIRDTVALIHRDAYATHIEPGDSFESHQAFMERFDAYTAGGGFDLVLAYLGDQPAGQAWGWPLTSSTRWWDGLSAEPGPGFTREDGTRTFAFSEIMVRQAYTGRHIARALHDKLLSGRTEQRATLLVNPANQAAYEIYRRWGWRTAAQLRPAWPGAPLFDVLILPLPASGHQQAGLTG